MSCDVTPYWENFCERLSVTLEVRDILYQKIVEYYNEEHRAYHNLEHIRDCLDYFDMARNLSQFPNELEWALWFHDIVYNIYRKDNEEQSAKIAKESLENFNILHINSNSVYFLIIATQHKSTSDNPEEQLIADIDLCILGQSRECFMKYEENIRREYSWVPTFFYKRNRKKFLQDFLSREHIFQTKFFRETYEAIARENIQYSLTLL